MKYKRICIFGFLVAIPLIFVPNAALYTAYALLAVGGAALIFIGPFIVIGFLWVVGSALRYTLIWLFDPVLHGFKNAKFSDW
ncbi:hypothetical protein LCGC14_2346470 [marine sediment metagenome]|uniref:Uncharacterized protein n=1 Tax=marine sediment metagenome TaxID=412755 RepID=A0A0F9CAE6_9ZZZZ